MFKINVINDSGLNILLVGAGDNVEYIRSSKFLRKLYTTSEKQIDGVVSISFNTFRELAQKCKALQIDLVIVEEEKWINEGIADVLKINHVNCIAPSAKWTQLALSNMYAREVLGKYNFNLPQITKLPAGFPLLVKADGFLKRADSVNDVIKIRQEIFERSPEIADGIYLERYLDGEKFFITSLFDGRNLLTFPNEQVESSLIQEFSAKTETMLREENADFISFIHSEVVLFEGKLYNTGFRFGFKKVECDLDILYLLWLAIYQKLNEVSI